jgi:hypothetical protein
MAVKDYGQYYKMYYGLQATTCYHINDNCIYTEIEYEVSGASEGIKSLVTKSTLISTFVDGDTVKQTLYEHLQKVGPKCLELALKYPPDENLLTFYEKKRIDEARSKAS